MPASASLPTEQYTTVVASRTLGFQVESLYVASQTEPDLSVAVTLRLRGHGSSSTVSEYGFDDHFEKAPEIL